MFEYHDKWKNPETGRNISHVYLMDGKRMTGVTTVLGMIAKPALIQWAADMACKFIKENWTTKKEDFDGKLGYLVTDEILEEARLAHKTIKETAGDKGTDVHALVEKYIKDCITLNNGEALAHETEDKMLLEFIKWAIKNKIKFIESEKKIYSQEWFVAGTADFTCVINDKRYVGDLKTMKKMWDRVPFMQTSAYRKMLVEMGEDAYDGSVIVNINKETNDLTEYYSYDWESDVKAFEAALTIYRYLQTGV